MSAVKLSLPQRDVLQRLARDGVLTVRLTPGAAGVEQTCLLGSAELQPRTVNALIASGLLERQEDVLEKSGGRRSTYVVSAAGRAVLGRA